MTYISASLVIRRMQIKPQRDIYIYIYIHTHTHTHKLPDRQTLKCLSIPNVREMCIRTHILVSYTFTWVLPESKRAQEFH